MSVLHDIIFNSYRWNAPWNQADIIGYGLHNWKRAWQSKEELGLLKELDQTLLHERWKKTGFFRYTFEYWCLGYSLYRRLKNIRDMKDDANHSMSQTARNTLLKHIDSSDMTQVHELIRKVQQIGVQSAVILE